jgi:UDP-3-O-[3-hydroxymyristoyl] glucosamine N-acyltransferase
MSLSVSQIAAALGLDYQGDGTRELRRVSSWETANNQSLVFYERRDKGPLAPGQVNAGCVVSERDLLLPGVTAILSAHPKLDFARAAGLFSPQVRGAGNRHPTSVVSHSARVAEDVDIGPWCVVGRGATVGEGTVLHAGVVVGEESRIGACCTLYPRVVLYPGVVLGDRVILHAGVVIGGDGFGYVFDGREQVKFPQVGAVVVGDDVEIGCNTTVDRGSLGVTRIAAGVKIDNLVQIAHNVEIGRGVVIAAQTGISGSTVIEDYAVIGGQVGFGDHARVQKGAVIGSKAGILPGKIVRSGEVYWGIPVRPLREYKRLNALFGRLPELKADIERLKEALAKLQSEVNPGKTEP